MYVEGVDEGTYHRYPMTTSSSLWQIGFAKMRLPPISKN